VLGLAAVVAAAAAAAALGAIKPINPPPTPSTFSLQINGVSVPSASYQIDGTTIPPKGPKGSGTPTQSYTVRITAPVSNNTTLLQDFQAGQIAGDVVITLYDNQLQKVVGYDFGANTADVSYQQTGDRTSGTFQQNLVFTSSSLTVST
jgi:hypothetical protein